MGFIDISSFLYRSLSDYEREITGLRSAMETLQLKLHDAERKLSLGSSNSSQSPRQSPSKVRRHMISVNSNIMSSS